jgi:uncharacterized protein YndB with AHSA1/START domain
MNGSTSLKPISLTIVRRIAARPSIVFDALITPEGLQAWFGPDDGPVLFAETDPRVGGVFLACFRMLDGTEHECGGTYIEVDPPRRLVMSWRWTDGGELKEGGPDGAPSQVEVDLRPIETGTELTFTHARLKSEASRASHEQGWAGSLDKLVRHFADLAGEA